MWELRFVLDGWGLRLKASVALMGAAVLCVFALRSLPYSTSFIIRGSEADSLETPGKTFSHGPLRWDMDAYANARSLDVFRDEFPMCRAMAGLDAARCVVDEIHRKSPHGVPAVEFLDAQFDPAAAFRQHMAGAPGHCTAQSFMLVTSLLALGTPARVVQIVPTIQTGHTVAEVWDRERGWLLFDPDNDSSFLLGDDFVSAAKLTTVTDGVRWRRPHESAPDPNIFAGATVNYPDPWLYTRVGSPAAPWPFRGTFVQIGRQQFNLGPAQHLALAGVIFFAVAALLVLVRLPRRRVVKLEVGVAEPESTSV